MAIFAKFEGVDGESADANHDKWIDVLSTDWGTTKPGAAGGNPFAVNVVRNEGN